MNQTRGIGKMEREQKISSGQKMNPTCTDSKCTSCHGSGWVLTEENGITYARECTCGIMRKEALQKSLQFANIPEAFSEVRLDSFRKDIYRREESRLIIEKDCKAIRWWLDNMQVMKEQGTGLYLYSGAKGSGKTRMAVSIANELIYAKGMTVKFATSIQILNEIKASWREEDGMTEHRLLNDLSEAEVLIIDDFGIETVKDWIEEKLYHIINTRYINRMITIFTSNLSMDELDYDDRIINRIKEKNFPLTFPNESVRDYIAEDNLKQLKAVMAS